MLSEAEFRSQALEKQLEEIPQDVTIAVAEKRVLETKLAHAMERGRFVTSDSSKKVTNDQRLLEEYQLTIHQLTSSLQQMKLQRFKNENCTVTIANGNRVKNDANIRSDCNNEIQMENINRGQEQKTEIVHTSVQKQCETDEDNLSLIHI